MLLVGFELTANQIALHMYTRQTRGLQSISETPAGYLPLIGVGHAPCVPQGIASGDSWNIFQVGAAKKRTTKKGEDEYRSKWLMGVM
jgi:hypothetical protein